MEHLIQGAGLGLRFPHIQHVLAHQPDVPWFEVHTCNFLGGGLNRALLHQVAELYPLSFHGVNLNLGGVDKLDEAYLKSLKSIIQEFNPSLVSEHLCFTSHNGQHFHDLLPVPFTEEAVQHIAGRIRQVQDMIGQRILVENVSRYYDYEGSTLSEAEFISAICEEADCGLVLDLNNAYVNERNLDQSVENLLAGLPMDRVGEIHLAGYSEIQGLLVDTHASNVSESVWQLYKQVTAQHANIPCLIEWDSDLPDWDVLMAERNKAAVIAQQVLVSVATIGSEYEQLQQ